MEENENKLEALIEKAEDYGKTSFELLKLQGVDKTSNLFSSLITHSVVLFFVASFLLFSNIGLALWIGKILEESFYGFFVVSGFYLLIGIIVHFFMHKWLKKRVCDLIIKKIL